MKTDFWASGNQFFPLSQTAFNCYQKKAVFHLARTYWKRGNEVFICFLSIVLFRDFFCKWKLLLKLRRSQFFKDEPYSCQQTPIFSIIQRFFKVEAALPYSGNLFFNILHTAGTNGYSAQWKQYFWSVLFYCQQKPLLE